MSESERKKIFGNGSNIHTSVSCWEKIINKIFRFCAKNRRSKVGEEEFPVHHPNTHKPVEQRQQYYRNWLPVWVVTVWCKSWKEFKNSEVQKLEFKVHHSNIHNLKLIFRKQYYRKIYFVHKFEKNNLPFITQNIHMHVWMRRKKI